jgi:hypothetical protein
VKLKAITVQMWIPSGLARDGTMESGSAPLMHMITGDVITAGDTTVAAGTTEEEVIAVVADIVEAIAARQSRSEV